MDLQAPEIEGNKISAIQVVILFFIVGLSILRTIKGLKDLWMVSDQSNLGTHIHIHY